MRPPEYCGAAKDYCASCRCCYKNFKGLGCNYLHGPECSGLFGANLPVATEIPVVDARALQEDVDTPVDESVPLGRA